jgi:hypothetical protein
MLQEFTCLTLDRSGSDGCPDGEEDPVHTLSLEGLLAILAHMPSLRTLSVSCVEHQQSVFLVLACTQISVDVMLDIERCSFHSDLDMADEDDVDELKAFFKGTQEWVQAPIHRS